VWKDTVDGYEAMHVSGKAKSAGWLSAKALVQKGRIELDPAPDDDVIY